MPDFEAQITSAIDVADEAPKGEIDKDEKALIANFLKLSSKLKAFETGNEEQQRALDKAIKNVADKYEGLTEDELREWIISDFIPSVPETNPGTRRFGKPPKESEVHKAWERLEAQQRNELLKEAMESAKTTSAQNRRFQQLEMLTTLIEGSQKIIEKGGKNLLEKAYKFLYIEEGELKDYNQRVENFLKNKVPQLSILIIKNPKTSLKDLLGQVGNPEIYDVYKKEGISLDECNTNEGLIRQKTALIKFLREAGDYQNVRFIAEEVLGPDFDKAFKKNLDQKPKQSRKVQIGEASKTIPVYADLYMSAQVEIYSKIDAAEMIAEIQKEVPDISYAEAKAEVKKYAESLVYQNYLHVKDERVMDFVHDTDAWEKWSPAKQEMWAEYKDSMGVGTFDISDESWDSILDELLVNAPLIIISGGIAAGVRAGVTKGFSYGARAVLGATRVGQIATKAGRLGRVVQSGIYNAGLGEFLEKYGGELFNTYISIGFLKISGTGIQIVNGRQMAFNAKKIAGTIKKNFPKRIG